MASPSVARLAEDLVRYMRWPTGSSNYLVEVNPDAFSGLYDEIAAAARRGVETGGILLGSLEPASKPILRIERRVIIAPRPEDGPAYLLNPQQQEEFAAAAQRAASGQMKPIGFFRSHLRSGPLAFSLADQSFLWKQFKSATALALLVDAREPHRALFSIWAEGRQVWQSAVPAISLPEKRPELPPREIPAAVRHPEIKQTKGLSPEWLVLLVAICFAVGVVLWPLWQATFGGPWAIPSPGDIALSIQEHGRDLDITWDKQMPEISRTDSAKLTIIDGAHRSELQLGKDDLKFGSVAYVHATGRVEANLILHMGDSTSLVQSTIWQGR